MAVYIEGHWFLVSIIYGNGAEHLTSIFINLEFLTFMVKFE